MSIYGYDSATGDLEIRNPWGTANGQSRDTTFEVSLSTLLSAGDTISVVAPLTSTSSVVQSMPVSAAAGLQADAQITAFSVTDSLANVLPNLASLSADSKLTGITLTGTGTQALTLTAAQFATDAPAVSLITSPITLAVTGATVAGAAALQANARVSSFTVSDTAANVAAGLTALKADGKLSGLTISGTAGADTLNLSGSAVAATINLSNDTASVSAGLPAPSLTFIGTPDAITPGSGAATIDYSLASSSGIETIANFHFGLDQLDIAMNGAASSVLHATGTQVGGQAAIALYSSASPTHGVVLTDPGSGMTAAALMGSHLTFSSGNAVIA